MLKPYLYGALEPENNLFDYLVNRIQSPNFVPQEHELTVYDCKLKEKRLNP